MPEVAPAIPVSAGSPNSTPVTGAAPNASPTGTPSPSPAPGVSPPPAASPEPFYSKWQDQRLKGVIEANGFKDTEMLGKSYDSLRTLFEQTKGVSPDQYTGIPKAEDKDGWNALYAKLGKPATPDAYEIPAEAGSDENFLKFAKGTFHEAGLSQTQAKQVAAKWNEFAANTMKAQLEAQGQKNVVEKQNLEKEWGKAFPDNVALAKKACAEFGLDAPTIDKLESVLGFAGVHKLFQQIGSKISEDGFVTGTGNRGSGNMTPQDAKNRIDYLRGDPEFTRNYLAKHAKETEEMNRLHEMAYPGSSQWGM